jgi:hypothetical protein
MFYECPLTDCAVLDLPLTEIEKARMAWRHEALNLSVFPADGLR